MGLSAQDIEINLSGANTVPELRDKVQRVLSDLLASLQSLPPILVLTDANAKIPASTTTGTLIFQLTASTTTYPYGTVKTNMFVNETKTIIPQS